MKSARHKSANNASTYQRDAATLYEINVEERFMENNTVGRFRSIHLEVGQHGTSVTPSTPYQKPLCQLVDWWYSHCLGYKDRPMTEPLRVLTFALRRTPDVTTMNELRVYAFKNVQPEVASKMMNLFKKFHHDAIQAEVQKTLLGVRSRDQDSIQQPEVATVSPIAKRQRRQGDIELRGRTTMTKTKGLQKLATIKQAHGQLETDCNGQKELLNSASKRWYNRHCVKVCKCLFEHLNGNDALFLSLYGESFKTEKHECQCDSASGVAV